MLALTKHDLGSGFTGSFLVWFWFLFIVYVHLSLSSFPSSASASVPCLEFFSPDQLVLFLRGLAANSDTVMLILAVKFMAPVE